MNESLQAVNGSSGTLDATSEFGTAAAPLKPAEPHDAVGVVRSHSAAVPPSSGTLDAARPKPPVPGKAQQLWFANRIIREEDGKQVESVERQGAALEMVREDDLWREEGFTSFEDFCLREHDMPARSARRLIGQSLFIRELRKKRSTLTAFPSRPSQVLPFLLLPRENWVEAWVESCVSGRALSVRVGLKFVDGYARRLGLPGAKESASEPEEMLPAGAPEATPQGGCAPQETEMGGFVSLDDLDALGLGSVAGGDAEARPAIQTRFVDVKTVGGRGEESRNANHRAQAAVMDALRAAGSGALETTHIAAALQHLEQADGMSARAERHAVIESRTLAAQYPTGIF